MYNLHSALHFGKHKSIPIWALSVCEPDYLEWCIKTIEGFCIEDLEALQALPSFGFGSAKYPDAFLQRISENKELYNSGLPETFFINEYLKIKGYDFYLKNLMPFLERSHKYSKVVMDINNRRIEEQKKRRIEEVRRQDLSDDSWSASENYTFDDTINDAFEGDSSNYWNVE